ncbi:MAG: hypothetical protein JWR01_1569 [Subtercola sp.]|nr:hypothetical protein [Subtercola sp.]
MSQTLDHGNTLPSRSQTLFGDVSLSTVTASGRRARRFVSTDQTEDGDEVRLMYSRSGTVGVTQDDRSTLAGERTLVILRSDSAYSYSTPGTLDVVIVGVPRDELRPGIVRALARVTARPLPQNALTASLIAFIDSAQSSVRAPLPPESAALQVFLTRLVVALVDRAVEDLRDSSGDARTLRLRVHADVESNADRSWFCSNEVAANAGVNPRRLHQLFLHEPMSVSECILRTRLERIVAELTAPDSAVSLAMIAERHGFRGLDQCARAFKRHFGETMREYRLASLL